MRIRSRSLRSQAQSRGFSLVELSVVVAIISVVATFGLEAAANFVGDSAVAVTRERVKTVDEATARFFKIYGRLPCPAVSSTAPTTSTYGLEDCTIAVYASTTIAGGVMGGAVPFRTLNLPLSASLDGFNSKLNYIVTKNLTVAGSTAANTYNYSAGTASTNGAGGIEVRTGTLQTTCSTTCQLVADPSSTTSPGAAYFIFSSGADLRGARSDKGATLASCTTGVANTDKRVDANNCVLGNSTTRGYITVGGVASTIPYNVFYDNRLNSGQNLTSYFDDICVWRSRQQL